MDQEKIGKFIAESRKKMGLTQQELGEKLGVSDRTIGNWENGRNMPDLSLFKPLCEELDITINDLISGEIVDNKNYKDKLEENIINTINYSNKKVNKVNFNIGLLLIIFGILISISALTIFESESSWGSIYSVLGGVISLIGISKLTRKMSYGKRLLICIGYFVFYIAVLFGLDYISVINNMQAPRFAYEKEWIPNMIIYKAPFYNVYRINYDTKNEYYIIDKKKEYNSDTVPYTIFNRNKSGIDNIIKYKNKYVGNNSNDINLINSLPLSEYGFTLEIDSKNLGLIINYHITDWYINENKYLEKSLIYNSVSMFLLIDNLEYINYNFSGDNYYIKRSVVESTYPNYDYIIKNNIKQNYFNEYVEKIVNNDEIVDVLFKQLFIDINLLDTKKIVVNNSDESKIIKTINNESVIKEVIELLSRGTKINGVVNLNGNSLTIYMYDKNNNIINKFLVWNNTNKGACFGINGKEYLLNGLDGEKLIELLTK